MKAQLITKEVIENLPNGTYAIFKDNQLEETIDISWVNYNDNNGRGARFDETGEFPTYVNEFVEHHKDCYIVLASEVKLHRD